MPIDFMTKRRSATFASTSAPSHYPADTRLAPVHTVIALRLDIPNLRAHGYVTHTIEAQDSGTLPLKLNAVALDVQHITSPDGELAWFAQDDMLHITWQDAWEAGTTRDVKIEYVIEKPASGLFFSSPSKDYPEAATYAATDHETERARHWLPTIDLPNVRATLEFHLTSDITHTILANGSLVEETPNDDGTKTAHWKLDYPCPSYLICFAVGLFTRADDGAFEGVDLAYFGDHTVSSDDLMRSFGRTEVMMDWMTKKLDEPFPFPKYYQFALPGFGGAMENISLVSWDDVFVLDETLAKEWTWLLDQINVHEMAHSYFGDAIVCRDYAHAWLKESWATYIETCWLEDSKGEDEMLYDIYRNQHAYFDEADNEYKRPIVTNVFDSSWFMYDRHLYPGGAVRIHMLRRLMGEENFWRGVRTYVSDSMGKVVETPDFRRAMEGACGRSLVEFFEQWIYSPGYPKLKADFSWDEETKQATFTIEQTQVTQAKAGDVKEPTFALSMAVGWTIDGESHTQALTMRASTHQVTVQLPSRPQMVRVDPNHQVVHHLSFNPGDDLLRAQLTDASDVIGRILAGRELAKTAKRANILALSKAYTNEAFWGVRQQWCGFMGAVQTQEAIDALVGWVQSEQDPMVLESLFNACSAVRDMALKDAIIERLPSLPYRAQMAALKALGAYTSDAPKEILRRYAQGSTWRALPEVGAITGLAASRTPDTAQLLLDLSKSGKTSNRARAAALQQAGKLSNYLSEAQRETIIDRLIDGLRDQNDRVRWSAAQGLSNAHAARARPALLAYRATLSHQEQAELDALLKGLAKPNEMVQALEKRLEEVLKTQRTLQSRLNKLEAKPEVSKTETPS